MDERGNSQKKRASEWGRLGEKIACEYIVKQGHPITATNWRCGNRLELDIISQQGDEMVFVEVKTRNGKYNSPEDALDEKKIKQIVRAANAYLNQCDREYNARFDVALVEGSPEDYEFTYIANAFVPPLTAR